MRGVQGHYQQQEPEHESIAGESLIPEKHPQIPWKALPNIAEAPKTAASAVMKASLGEDKYAGMNS